MIYRKGMTFDESDKCVSLHVPGDLNRKGQENLANLVCYLCEKIEENRIPRKGNIQV